MLRPANVWAEITGGDALGRGSQPALCWWLPDGARVQHAYRVRTDVGFDSGRVAGPVQSFVRVPVFDRSRRCAAAQVKVWTDLGESEWSDPVILESGLREEADWQARWIGVAEDQPGAGGARSRPAYWLRTSFEVPRFSLARLYVTAFGLYEAFIDGQRVGDVELAPGYTQYRARVQYQAYDVTPLVTPGRRVLAVLLADGWYRGRVGLPRAVDQYGRDVALRAQLEVMTEEGWRIVAASAPGWRTAPSRIVAADLIAGQREDHRRLEPAVHDASAGDLPWRSAVPRDVAVAIVRSVAPPVRRVEEKGAVATFLHRYVAGLRPTEPAYRSFEVRPQPGGGLTWATTRHVSPYGPIEVSWRLAGGSMELDVLVPGGTTATVIMPGGAPGLVGPGRHRWIGAPA
jgi:alpha-L-rhamnosidase